MNDALKTYTKSDFPLGKSGYSTYTIFEYKFESLHSFISYIKSQPVNKKIFESLSSETENYKFTKTNSFDEAINLCMYGCDENFEKFLKLKNEVSKSLLNPLEKSIIYKDVVGYAPSVPDFLIGSPLNMWNKKTSYFDNLIDVYIQLGYPYFTETSQIYNRGAITLSLIDALEKFGYSVNLIPFSLSIDYDEIILAYFNLKDTSSYINEKKCFFPLCHPAFHRRLVFKLIETTPVESHGWASGYGSPKSNIDIIKKIINCKENSIIISAPGRLNISGENIYEDLQAMLKCIDFEKYITRY